MWKTIITIVILALLAYGISFFVKPQEKQTTQTPEETQITKTLDIKHQYKDGAHTFVGSLDLPNPCYTYNAVIEDTTNPTAKILRIILDKQVSATTTCPQIPSKATYSVTYKGEKNLTFRGFVNDEEYNLNFFEIPDDVDINTFEIFTKG